MVQNGKEKLNWTKILGGWQVKQDEPDEEELCF